MAKVESTDGDQQHKQQEAENGSRDGGHVMSPQTGMMSPQTGMNT